MNKKLKNTMLLLIIIMLLILFFFIPNIFDYFFNSDNKLYPKSIYIDQKLKIDNYINNKNLENTKPIQDHRKLFELYYQGVNEKYDLNGNKIPGVKPDPEKAIFHLKELIYSNYGTNNDVLKLAKIYHQGMFNFEPNLDEAEKIYNSILNNCGEIQIRNDAISGINDINIIKTHKWLNIPLNRNITNQNIIPPDNHFDYIIDIDNFIIDELLDDDLITTKYGTKEYNDPQNVHDSQVISTMKNSIKNLSSKNLSNNSNNSYYEIMNFLNSQKNNQKIHDAKLSLNSIKDINNSFVNNPLNDDINITEMDVLKLVWQRIKDPIFNDNRDNIKDILIEQLASMQEHNKIVCSTGRFTRIIDTLNVVDPEVMIKPKYAINEEMMNKSANIRNKLLESRSDKDLLESGNSPNQIDFDNLLKETIIKELYDDYVKTNILSQPDFNSEINKWINEI